VIKQMGSEEDMVWETEGVHGSEWEGIVALDGGIGEDGLNG